MRKLLPITPLLLYAGIALAAAPVSPGDTTLLPITTLLPRPLTHASPLGRPITGRLRTPPPLSTPPAHLTLRLSNPSQTLPISHIALEWELQVNGTSRQKGKTGNLTIAPQHSTLVRLPVRWPAADTNEVFLLLRYRRSPYTIPATQPPGPLLSEEQLLVQTPAGNTPEVRPDGELTFTDENDTFTIHSPLIHIEFNKETGWLQRYEAGGTILLTDTPVLKSNFWLPGTPGDTATAWREASHDPHLQLFSTSTGNTMIIVRAEYTLPATSCLLHVSYIINAKGEMLVGQQLEEDSTLKTDSTLKELPLPCFGMRWLLPTEYDSVEYYGLGRAGDSTNPYASTNPYDSIRLHAPWTAIYHDTIDHLSSPDSLRQHIAMVTGLITAIRWFRITGPDGSGLLVTADSTLLNAGALPNSPSVLLHIDSRQPSAPGTPGNNDQLSYGLPYGNYRCTFKISPIISHHTIVSSHP